MFHSSIVNILPVLLPTRAALPQGLSKEERHPYDMKGKADRERFDKDKEKYLRRLARLQREAKTLEEAAHEEEACLAAQPPPALPTPAPFTPFEPSALTTQLLLLQEMQRQEQVAQAHQSAHRDMLARLALEQVRLLQPSSHPPAASRALPAREQETFAGPAAPSEPTFAVLSAGRCVTYPFHRLSPPAHRQALVRPAGGWIRDTGPPNALPAFIGPGLQ